MRHPWLQVNLLTAFAPARGQPVRGHHHPDRGAGGFPADPAGQSGNTGCQALAITLRGITLGDLNHISRAQADHEGVGSGGHERRADGRRRGSGDVLDRRRQPHEALLLGFVILLAITGACMASGLFGCWCR